MKSRMKVQKTLRKTIGGAVTARRRRAGEKRR